MSSIVIVGAGGFDREVYGYARAMPENGAEWAIKGFVDDNPRALDGYDDIAHPILGPIREYQPAPGDVFVNGIGQPALRRELVGILAAKGAVFTSVIHPSAVIGRNVAHGVGCVFPPNVVVTADARIGDHVCLNVGTCVSHNATLGDFVQTSNFCDITGYVTLEDGVFLGSHASVLPNVTVGAWAKVGAGAVVVNDVAPDSTVVGVPARRLPGR